MRRWADSNPPAHAERGFTLLELTIVIILVVLLFLTAYDRLMPLRGHAEAAHVATTVGTLRSALGLAVAERIIADDTDGVATLAGSNPMDLLSEVPTRFTGTSEEAPPGHWFFEEDTGLLKYHVRYAQYLTGTPREPVVLAWRIEVERSVHSKGEEQRIRSVSLVAQNNPGWAFDESAQSLAASP